MNQIHKYPRTQHLQGSKFQDGDFDLEHVPIPEIVGKYLVIEEKMDGANCGISFVEDEKKLQSRGHYLTGGYREKHFDLFKSWSHEYYLQLKELLGERYVMFGEWLYAKHTIYYDILPSYFMEFDIYDTETKTYMSTKKRKEFLSGLDFIHSVKVIDDGIFTLRELNKLENYIDYSNFMGDHPYLDLIEKCESRDDIQWTEIRKETDLTKLMEGLYIKWEEDGIVKGRYKYVRGDFLDNVAKSGSHWLDRPIIPNSIL